MSSENIGVVITFGVYLVVLIIIGRLGERKHSKSYEDFVSADKSLGSIATALSAAASSESVWVMLGLSGIGYWKGIAAFWAALGCVLGFVVNAIFITVQLRRDSDRFAALTVSDYIEARLGDRTKILRLVSAVLITFFMISYVVAQFTGAGKLFAGMELLGTDTPYWLGVVIGAAIIGVYIFLGGYAAVCWTDTVQGILMFVVMLGLPVLALVKTGGFGGIIDALAPLGLLSLSPPETAGWTAAGFIAGQLGIGIGYPGMPHMIIRYITVRDDRAAKQAAWISILWSAVVLFGSTFLGLAARALFPDIADSQKTAEQVVLPHFCRAYLSPVLTGVVLSAITAAIMSTADSQLMYAATSLVNDLWLKVRKGGEIAGQRLILITRSVLVAMTLVAMGFALLDVRLIYTFVLFAWGALGSAFTPIIILSLYWKRFTRWGALAALITGPAVVVIWYNIEALHQALYELIPAFGLSFAAAVVVSLVTWEDEKGNVRPPGREPALARIDLQRPIAEKIAWAESQFREAAALRRDPEVAVMLDRLTAARRDSRAAMAASGMIEICEECEVRGGGSCCGAGIEDRYDGVTLLINLLLGGELPRARRATADCWFLGDRGCRLWTRHVICVNYLCEHLGERVDAGRLAALRDAEGEELELSFRLHTRLTRLLNS